MVEKKKKEKSKKKIAEKIKDVCDQIAAILSFRWGRKF